MVRTQDGFLGVSNRADAGKQDVMESSRTATLPSVQIPHRKSNRTFLEKRELKGGLEEGFGE